MISCLQDNSNRAIIGKKERTGRTEKLQRPSIPRRIGPKGHGALNQLHSKADGALVIRKFDFTDIGRRVSWWVWALNIKAAIGQLD